MNNFYRSILIMLIALNLSQNESHAQNCRPITGDEYYLKNKSLNLRSKPDKNSTIIKVLDNATHSLIIFDSDSIINNFILVIAIGDTINSETLERDITEEFYGWVSYDLINFNNDSYSFIRHNRPSEKFINDIIQEQESYKRSKSCKYNPTKLAYAYCEYGKIKYLEKEYIKSMDLFSKTIDVATINSVTEKFVSLFYRGLCKMQLDDNYGAISDFNKVSAQNELKQNGVYIIGWAYKTKDYYLRISGTNVPIIDLEDVYLNSSACKATLKKYSEALLNINKIIQNNKKCGSAYFMRAQINQQINKTTESCIDASMAGELGIDEAYEFISMFCR